MSEVSTQRVSVRLNTEDQVALDALSHLYGLNRSDTLRNAIRQALKQHRGACPSGYFVPVGIADPPAIPIRHNRKATYG